MGSRSGCGVMAAIVLVIVVFTVWPMYTAWQAVIRFEQTAKEAGYEVISDRGIALVNDDPVQKPSFFRAVDSVQIMRGANADIAVSARDADLDGTFTGNVAFLGQNLTVLPGAIIEGDLEIAAAKNVTIRGEVRGEIRGEYRRIFHPKPTPEPTPESTPESTPEPTPESTPEPGKKP